MNPLIALLVLSLLLGGMYCFWHRVSFRPFQEQNKNIRIHHEQRKTRYQKSLRALHLEEQKETLRKHKLAYHTLLYELYYAGIPDRYDNSGNKIKGVEPDAHQVIKHLKKLITYSPRLKKGGVRLKLAKLYHLGMHEFQPQLNVAKKMYTSMIVSGGLTDEVYVQTKDLLKRINREIYQDYVNQKEVRPNKVQRKRMVNPPVWVNYPVNTNRNPRRAVATPPPLPETPPPLPETPPALPDNAIDYENERVNDPQNTHNSQVLSTTLNSINNLKKSTKLEKSLPATLKEVRRFLNNLPKNDKRADALKSLNRIEQNTSPFTFSAMKEVDVLHLIWNRIHSNVHSDNLKAVKKSLFNQLADMQEHGVTVCATGRFTRLVDTLNVVDNEVAIKPSYVINQEMMNKSSKIRENMLKTYGESERKELEKGTSGIQEQFDQNLKEKIVETLKEDYVKTKILTPGKFEQQINRWIDDI